jgi:hypothetical protein
MFLFEDNDFFCIYHVVLLFECRFTFNRVQDLLLLLNKAFIGQGWQFGSRESLGSEVACKFWATERDQGTLR